MSIKISALPNVIAANIADVDILPIVSAGITSRVAISELRIKLGFPSFYSGNRTVTDLRVYLANNAVYNVKDFGAVGDGVTDDTVAFNKARQAQIDNQGGAIYVPTSYSGHSYVVSSINMRGLNPGTPTDCPFVLIGEDMNRTQLQHKTGDTGIMIELGNLDTLTGNCIWNVWFTGNATAAGAVRIGGESNSCILGTFKFRVNSYVSSTANSGYGAFGVSLDSSQQNDFRNCRLDANYNNYFRPNWGFVAATVISGGGSDISHALNRGVQIAGEISDLLISQGAVIENNQHEGLADISNPATGTVTITGTGPFTATFSTAQTGLIGEKGYFVVGGHMYLAQGFNAGKTIATNVVCITGGPNTIGATAFRYEFRTNITLDSNVYIEANCLAGSGSLLGDIAIQGSSAPNSDGHITLRNVNFHSNNGTPKIYFDHVTKSEVRNCKGLSFIGSITTTANTQAHFAFNSDSSATDMTGIYNTLLGKITYEEMDRTTGVGGGKAHWIGGERYYNAAQRVRGINSSGVFAADTSYENGGAGMAMADTAVVVLAAAAPRAFIEIADSVTGGAALFWVDSAQTVIIWQTAGVHFATVKDTAAKINVYIETGALKIQNKAANGAGGSISIYGQIRRVQ